MTFSVHLPCLQQTQYPKFKLTKKIRKEEREVEEVKKVCRGENMRNTL
jgi:hypothetical protein